MDDVAVAVEFDLRAARRCEPVGEVQAPRVSLMRSAHSARMIACSLSFVVEVAGSGQHLSDLALRHTLGGFECAPDAAQ